MRKYVLRRFWEMSWIPSLKAKFIVEPMDCCLLVLRTLRKGIPLTVLLQLYFLMDVAHRPVSIFHSMNALMGGALPLLVIRTRK